ncbi:MAG: PhnD/SsuA/transferrin family substrate-binding protein [bacterium]
MMTRIKSFLVLMTASALGLSAPALLQEKTKLLFIAPTFNIEGVGFSLDTIKQIGEELIKKIEKQTGLSFDYEMVGSPKDSQDEAMDKTVERLKEGGDFSWMDYHHYREARQQNVPIKPVALLTVGGKITQKNCLFIKKGTSIKKLEDLRGKRIAGGTQLDWTTMRALMYENGIDEPPTQFFKLLVPVDSFFALPTGVVMGSFETFLMSETLYQVIKSSNPNVVPLVCTEAMTNGVFPVYRENLDQDVMNKFKAILFNAHNDPEMGVVFNIMKTAGVGFAEASPELMKSLEDSYQRSLKRGWIREHEAYMLELKALAKKRGELKKCRKNCDKEKKEEDKNICLDLCDQKHK